MSDHAEAELVLAIERIGDLDTELSKAQERIRELEAELIKWRACPKYLEQAFNEGDGTYKP